MMKNCMWSVHYTPHVCNRIIRRTACVAGVLEYPLSKTEDAHRAARQESADQAGVEELVTNREGRLQATVAGMFMSFFQ